MSDVTTVESFEGVVVAFEDGHVMLRTTSSDGEEAVAWLSLVHVPEPDRRSLQLFDTLKVEILRQVKPRCWLHKVSKLSDKEVP